MSDEGPAVSTVSPEGCQSKRLRGNVYRSESQATAAAVRMSREKQCQIVPFRCKHCRLWHVGSWMRG